MKQISLDLFFVFLYLLLYADMYSIQMGMAWSETGDRFLLKLFREYLFHQVTESGKPWIDMAHIITCLNKVFLHCLNIDCRDRSSVIFFISLFVFK